MQTQELTIRVTPVAARLYQSASEQEKRKLDVLLSLRLSEIAVPSRSLQEIMRESSQEAKENGITEDILKELLDGE